MSNVNVVVGLSLGDCGKGRITDIYSETADLVVRVQGGNNAGHTIVVGDQKFKLHHIPSGIVRDKYCLLGAGMVIDPIIFEQEIATLENQGFDTSKILIDGSAHINFPVYSLIDKQQENNREFIGDKSIGTTSRGIGPAYTNKYQRTGWRYWQILNTINKVKLTKYFRDVYYGGLVESKNAVDILLPYLELMRHRIVDGRKLIGEYKNQNKNILIEGAQGCWLDIDYGQYPFVTSSCTTSAGACLGTGLGVKDINQIIGVTKAYSTYVGNGAYPAEANEEDGNFLREAGGEYGTTTGRPRRCGWLDIPMLKDAIIINSCTDIVMTKIDVLSGLEKIKIVKAYDLDGQIIDYVPSNPADYASCKPVYEEIDGWESFSKNNLKYISDLPKNAYLYIEAINDNLDKCYIDTISYGPEREQIVSGVLHA